MLLFWGLFMYWRPTSVAIRWSQTRALLVEQPPNSQEIRSDQKIANKDEMQSSCTLRCSFSGTFFTNKQTFKSVIILLFPPECWERILRGQKEMAGFGAVPWIWDLANHLLLARLNQQHWRSQGRRSGGGAVQQLCPIVWFVSCNSWQSLAFFAHCAADTIFTSDHERWMSGTPQSPSPVKNVCKTRNISPRTSSRPENNVIVVSTPKQFSQLELTTVTSDEWPVTSDQ